MCGMILMSLSQPSTPFSTNTSSSAKASLLGFGPHPPSLTKLNHSMQRRHSPRPATQAVNDLLNDEKKKARSSSTSSSSNKTSNHDLDFPDLDFPTIEWCLSEEEDELDLSTASAPARFFNPKPKPPRRASLVRSISLVSDIMKELYAPNKKRSLKLAHRKTKRRPKVNNRLMALTHPTTSEGLQVSRHEGTHKFFL